MEKKLSPPLDYKTLPPEAEAIQRELQKSIIAQDRAVGEIVEKYITFAFSDPDRPKGIFFLAGPTGVGKTEVVKVFAEFLFGSKDALTRIDCNTLKNEADIWRLLGSPAGYVGFMEKNRLFNQRSIDKWGFFKKIAEDLKNNPSKQKKVAQQYTGLFKEKIKEFTKNIAALQNDIVYTEREMNRIGSTRSLTPEEKEQLKSYKDEANRYIVSLKKQIETKQCQIFDIENSPAALIDLIRKNYETLLKKITLLKGAKMSQNNDLIEAEEDLEKIEKEFDYVPGRYEAIVLFDEFEKVHPSLYDPVLSIIDEARLALSDNTVVKFNNCYIFFTSNIGSGEIKKILTGVEMGFQRGVSSESVDRLIYDYTLAEIDKFFLNRPEILGRIGKESITIFRPFNREEIKIILEKCAIPKFAEIVKKKININIIVEDSFKEKIVDEAFDKFNRPLGARPLLRIAVKRLQEPLCILFLNGQVAAGDTVVVNYEDNKITFRKIINENPAPI